MLPVRRKGFLETQGRRDTQVKSLGGVPRESYCIIVLTYICLPSRRRPSVASVGSGGGDAAVKSFGSAYFFPFPFSALSSILCSHLGEKWPFQNDVPSTSTMRSEDNFQISYGRPGRTKNTMLNETAEC